jgi:phenylalanyl-tRNA synthetase beta chain
LKHYVAVAAMAEEVATRLTMGGLEVEGIEESALGPVLDVYVTPNRGDCLSVVGVAREVAALYSLPLNAPQPPASELGGETATQTSVTIEDAELCPRYAARLVRGVKVGPSPDWMQARLEAAGMRPINNVVDVTNYVMLELGQPLHAFDFDRLAGRRIVVRRARDGETLRTLDGEERVLTTEMLVIADAEKAVAVAGVMGGAETEVSDATTNLLLESAHFYPLSVRRTSRTLALRTEASYRFERIVDPDGVPRAADRVCELLAAMGQPEAVPGGVDVYPQPAARREVSLRVRRASELLGMEITSDIAVNCLTRLGLAVKPEPDGAALKVSVPAFRPDLTLEEDLIEEVGRIYGYENIPETLPVGDTTTGGDSAEGRFSMRIKRLLAACGLQEVVTHGLTAPSFFDSPEDAARRVAIRNALSAEVGGLRSSLIPTLLDVAQHNATRGQHALAIFEVGRVWQNEATDDGRLPVETVNVAGLLVGPMTPPGWQKDVKRIPADFYTARGVVERLFAGLCIGEAAFDRMEASALFHPGRTATIRLNGNANGVIGEIHPQVAARLGIRERVYVFEIGLEALKKASPADGPAYRPLSRFPAVSRDLAPRVPEGLTYAAVEAAVRAANVTLLEEFRLTDVFRGDPLPESVKSLTLSFTFRASDRTLSDAEIDTAMASIRKELEARCQATFLA